MPFQQGGFYYATWPPVVAGGVVVVSGAVQRQLRQLTRRPA